MFLIAFFSLITLVVIHEFGHFIVAKKFGVKVEEFGVFFPPRLFGKKFGETLYSFNLLPFGAFVKIYGEEGGGLEDARSFSTKPVWQRALIILAGVISFWIVAVILLSVVMGLGAPTAISDEDNGKLQNPKVQISVLSPGSPAEVAGLRIGDTIRELIINDQKFTVSKVKDVQAFTQLYKGKEVTLNIERGKKILEVSLIVRSEPPEGEGPMGVALVRTAIKSYPWYLTPIEGIKATGSLTFTIIQSLGQILKNIFIGKGVPSGVEFMGPIGIVSLVAQVSQLGIVYFLQFIALLAIYLAIFNILPLPALDGGKLVFLGIEAVRKKPVSRKVEQNITAVFFALLILSMILVTIKDIKSFF
ncbi:MAG: M50 family metallopeptidase [Patescibacteria group bacterium]